MQSSATSPLGASAGEAKRPPPHVRTGRPPGARPGNTQTVKHGLKTAAMIENRRAFVALMKATRQAIRELG
jgi:hypothetical protein